MNLNFLKSAALVAACIAALPPLTAQAESATVAAGWSLFETQPTSFQSFAGNNVYFTGIPLNTFDLATGTDGDFGRGLGVQDVGATDVVIKRLSDATVTSTPGSATIPVEIEAGQWFVPDLLPFLTPTPYATLHAPTQGSMTINLNDANSGTFSISLPNLLIDFRETSVDSPVVGQNKISIEPANVPWQRDPTTGALMIPGANYMLNGIDSSSDFFPVGPVSTSYIDFFQTMITTPVPEPSSIVLACLAAAGFAVPVLRRRNR